MVESPRGHTLTDFRAFLFDLDGVVTPTVDLHLQAWRDVCNALFTDLALPAFRDQEYYAYLDGRPRFDGVQALLHARAIELPPGDADDYGLGSIRGIGNRKNEHFAELLERQGIAPYPGTLRLLDALAARGAALGLVSSSRNAEAVLAAAGVRNRFTVVVDGVVAAAEGLPGKPDPATFVVAARRLGVAPAEAVVFEDAESGVAAARAGGFGLVVGVDRGAGAAALRAAGADVVVDDLGEFV